MARINEIRFNILVMSKFLIDFVFVITLSVIYKNGSYMMEFKKDNLSDKEEGEKTVNRYNSETELYKMTDQYDYISQVYVRAYMIQYILTSFMACAITCRCGNLQVNYKCNFLQSSAFLFIYCILLILHVTLLDGYQERIK